MMVRPFAQLVCAVTLLAATAALAAPTADRASKPDQTTAGKTKKKPQPPFKWVNKRAKALSTGVRHGTFESAIAGQPVGYHIYLPPSYESGTQRFPVVYYLHGGRPGSEQKGLGLAEMIHAAMASGRVPEAIYVFVNGGPVSHYNTPAEPAIKQQETRGADVFITELIPHIDATYRTIADRSGRALEGFSQGGRGTARLAFRYPELFGSAAPGGGGYATEKRISESDGYEHPRLRFADGDNAYDLAAAYAEGDNPELPLLVYVGTKGFNYQNNLAYMTYLDSLGIEYDKLIVPKMPHSAAKIYDVAGERIMTFHAKNFAAAREE